MTPRSGSRLLPALAATAFILAAAIGAVLACLQAACLDRSPSPVTERLKLALPSAPVAALLHVAAEKGFFAEAGLDVTVVPTTHGKAALDQAMAGEVDLAVVADVPFVLSVIRGEPVAMLARVASVSNENAVVARRDAGIDTPRDLAGRRIGVTLGTSAEYFLWSFLGWNRIDPASVILVDTAPGAIVGHLVSGAIDAATAWPPVVGEAQAELGGNGVTFGEPDAYTLSFVIAGRENFLRGHPGAAIRFLQALVKAERLNEADPEQCLQLVAGRLGVDPATLRPTWGRFRLKVDLSQSQLTTMEEQARWAWGRGYAPTAKAPDFRRNMLVEPLLAVEPRRMSVVR
jgi:NitT/TauT family transport system substrate-binding protein